MKDQGEFGERHTTPGGKSGGSSSGRLDCAAVELLWAEAAEGLVPDTVAEQLRVHTAECASCREKIELARRGHEWLLILKQEPLSPPADMVAKILAKTSNAVETPSASQKLGIAGVLTGPRARHAATEPLSGFAAVDDRGILADTTDGHARDLRQQDPAVSSAPVWQHASVVLLRRTVLDPRMALVAAMAFFSIALTLNLAGVKLTKLRAADLEPQSMRRAVTRQYAEANARVVRYYENLRIVYEVESRVHQLRQAADSGPQQAPNGDKSGGKRSSNSGGDSSSDPAESHRPGITANTEIRGTNHAIQPDPKPVIVGPRLDAALRRPMRSSTGVWGEEHPIGPVAAASDAELVAFRLPLRDAQQTFSSVHSTFCFSMRCFSTQERRLA